MIKNLSRSINLHIWDGRKNGKYVQAPSGSTEWLDAAFAKGYQRALADVRAALNAESPWMISG